MKSRSSSFFLLVLAALILSACSLGDTPPATNSDQVNNESSVENNSAVPGNDAEEAEIGNEEIPISETDETSKSLCANRYVPVVDGASWTFASSGSFGESYSFTNTITAASSTGYTLVSDFGDLTKSQSWGCRETGLVALEYSSGSEASVTTTGFLTTLETTGMTGVTIPNQINPGDTWTQSFEVSGQSTLEGGFTAETSGSVAVSWTAVGLEQVVVPAGTFEAVKVAVETQLDLTTVMEGVSVPLQMNETGNIWLVEDLGWVKSESSYSFMDMSATSTIELTSYSIP